MILIMSHRLKDLARLTFTSEGALREVKEQLRETLSLDFTIDDIASYQDFYCALDRRPNDRSCEALVLLLFKMQKECECSLHTLRIHLMAMYSYWEFYCS